MSDSFLGDGANPTDVTPNTGSGGFFDWFYNDKYKAGTLDANGNRIGATGDSGFLQNQDGTFSFDKLGEIGGFAADIANAWMNLGQFNNAERALSHQIGMDNKQFGVQSRLAQDQMQQRDNRQAAAMGQQAQQVAAFTGLGNAPLTQPNQMPLIGGQQPPPMLGNPQQRYPV